MTPISCLMSLTNPRKLKAFNFDNFENSHNSVQKMRTPLK